MSERGRVSQESLPHQLQWACLCAQLKKSAAGLHEQADTLQGQIDNAGGPKMKKQKQAVSDLQQVTLQMHKLSQSCIDALHY